MEENRPLVRTYSFLSNGLTQIVRIACTTIFVSLGTIVSSLYSWLRSNIEPPTRRDMNSTEAIETITKAENKSGVAEYMTAEICADNINLEKNERKKMLSDNDLALADDYLRKRKEKNRGNTAEEHSRKCVICYENLKTTMIEPCRHYCICEECAKKVRNECPVCRATITGFTRVYEC